MGVSLHFDLVFFERGYLLGVSSSSSAAAVLSPVLLAVVVLPDGGAGPGIREGYGNRFLLDSMRALMRIPPGVNSDVLEKEVASGVNWLYGSAFFGRFGEGVLGAMVGAR